MCVCICVNVSVCVCPTPLFDFSRVVSALAFLAEETLSSVRIPWTMFIVSLNSSSSSASSALGFTEPARLVVAISSCVG